MGVRVKHKHKHKHQLGRSKLAALLRAPRVDGVDADAIKPHEFVIQRTKDIKGTGPDLYRNAFSRFMRQKGYAVEKVLGEGGQGGILL